MRPNRIFFALALTAALCGSALSQVTPKQQALKLMTALHKEDWKALYYLISVSPNMKKSLNGADRFAADVKRGMGTGEQAQAAHKVFAGMKNIRTGQPRISGSKAVVPTSCTITINGKTMNFNGVANMIMEKGVWKWNLSGSDDLKTETSTQIQLLIGKPGK